MGKPKYFCLDTSVLLYNPRCIQQFKDNKVVIPYVVLEEIDKVKSREDQAGKHAREVVRRLNELRKEGDLNKGVEVNSYKGTLYVEMNFNHSVSKNLNLSVNDDRILNVCLGLQKDKNKVVLITKDINLAVRADVLGIETQDFGSDRVVESSEELYSGTNEIKISDNLIDIFYAGEEVIIPEFDLDLFPNQYLVLVSNENSSKTALARYLGPEKPLKKINTYHDIWGIKARNKEQRFAIDALLDPSVSLVTLVGKAGAGKTLMALACGLKQTQDDNIYQRLVVCRPTQPLGKDIGYLPGPQPLDAKILTPTGWTTMGSLSVGDEVISRKGTPTKVLGIFPKGKKPVYKVKTNEGQETECCEDHIWRVFSSMDVFYNKTGRLKTTEQLKSILDSKGKLDFSLPRNEAVSFVDTSLPIPPYLLGAFLGVSNVDKEILERVSLELETLGCSLNKIDKIHHNVVLGKECSPKNRLPVSTLSVETGEEIVFDSYKEAATSMCVSESTMKSRCRRESTVFGTRFTYLPKFSEYKNPVKEILSALGLLYTKASTKFIPDIYKYTSIENRLDILRGLMDTDGSVRPDGYTCFYTSSKKLANDVIEIVRSLGGRSSLRVINRLGRVAFVLKKQKCTTRKLEYCCTISLPEKFNPFFLQRKKERYKQFQMRRTYIESIESLGEKEVQCIRVADPEHLYITDDYIVTHNTMEEKMSVWMGPIKDSLNYLTKNRDRRRNLYQEMVDMNLLEVEALTYIQGRSLANTYLLIDESQNLTRLEVKALVSRLGENSKLVLVGDVMQINHPYIDPTNSGLSTVVQKFKPYDVAAHITLRKGERSRLADLASEIL